MEEAAVLLRIGRTKAYSMTREWRSSGGESGLPVVDFGNVLRVPRHKLEELIGAPLVTPALTESAEPGATPHGDGEPRVTDRRSPRRSNRGRRSSGRGNQLELFGNTTSADGRTS